MGKKVFTTKGALSYDKLLIASGVYPKKLQVSGADRDNVFCLWNMKDAERLEARIAEIKKSDKIKQRAAVIGGGFICQTFLKIFISRGLETHLLMRGDWYWPRFIGQEAGRLLEEKFLENNIILHKQEKVKDIAQDDDTLIIKTEKGKEIETSLVLAGIGTEPNIDFVAGTDIEIDDGILVDQFMKTSAPHVWACGDVVNFYDLVLETQHRQGNWANATRQGRIAGINMSGGHEVYEELTFFLIDVFGLKVMFLGDYGRDRADDVVVRMSVKQKKAREYYFKDNRLIGACLVGAPEDRLLIEAAIKAKIELNKEQRLELADENIPLGQSKLYANK
ncbi:FAD-dependent oxidoreductase [Patescibacteria group bacterium]|nr:FAD-dependent oxidoreductase [Patescibacteria group bacterium]